MRQEFLRNVAGQFYRLTEGELRGYCFVFPNRRSSLFFKRYLGEIAERPVFSLQLLTSMICLRNFLVFAFWTA